MSLTNDPADPRLGHGVDSAPIPQHEVYLVLSDEERAKGFVRPVRRAYVHQYWIDGRDEPFPTVLTDMTGIGGCGAVTTMGTALAETYARNPSFYGATYCVRCAMHKAVGERGEFIWDDGSGQKVGT